MVDKSSKHLQKLETVKVISQHDTSEIEAALATERFKIVEKDPDFIICYGGDGTVLYSERTIPEVPKLIIKTSRVCRKCDYNRKDLKKLLSKIRKGNYCLHKKIKLEAEAKGKKLVGLNEIQIHLKLPIYAVRFSLSVNGIEYEELIGDGVIIATPFGSTGYYKATGGESFENGIGISFNNLHNIPAENFVVNEDSVVRLDIIRGPAWLLADNNEDFFELDVGDSVVVRMAETIANFIYVPNL
jgi:NAD+ kinase